MASRSSSPSPGQSGQDDVRDDDADSASDHNLATNNRHDESPDSESEAVANGLISQGNAADDDAEEDMVGNSSNVSRSDEVNEAQPGASSSSSLEVRGNVSGSFQVMMMSDNIDDDDDDDEDLEDIAKFAAASSSSHLRRSPYLSSTTSSSRNIDDLVTFSPQPSSSSSGLNNFIPTTSSTTSHPPNFSDAESQVVNNLHGEISNPPSPLGGTSSSRPALRPSRPDSPQAGPSGMGLHKRSAAPVNLVSDSSSSKRPSLEGPAASRQPSIQQGHHGLTFMAAAAAALAKSSSSSSSSSGIVQPQPQRFPQNAISSSEAVPVPIDDDSDDEAIVPPHTPADNYLISSSTGVIPPTPVDVHDDGDLSVPSPSQGQPRTLNHHQVDVDDMIDSTVDSSSINQRPLEAAVLTMEGPAQSSHYEDSSDDDDDDRPLRPQFSRHNSAIDSGISTSGQVDDGHFRLVPNNLEDERYNQYNPPRSSMASSSTSSSNNRAASSSSLFCEAGPSRPRNGHRNNGLEYDLDDDLHFDPAHSSFPPVDLEDIQVQNLVPETFKTASTSTASEVVSRSDQFKYINNNNEVKDVTSAAGLGNISLAFSGLPGKSSSVASTSSEAAKMLSNNNSHHSSILESMTGPLSKRLRTLHSLQQQQSSTSTPASDSSKKNESKESSAAAPSSSSTSKSSFDPENHEDHHHDHHDDNAPDPGASGSSGSSANCQNIQTFSVTIETSGNAIKPKKFFQQKSAHENEEDVLFNVIHPLGDHEDNCLALNRSRRQIKKKKAMHYCDQCRIEYDSECPLHQPVLLQISDQPIMTRALASLPSEYLSLRSLGGVYARKTIPKSCRFGPLEGKKVTPMSEDKGDEHEFVLTVIEDDNATVVKIDVSDEEESNWMRFVRPAERFAEQNLILSQENGQLFFTSTRNISPRQELRVGYSPAYGAARGLRHLVPTSEEMQSFDDDLNSWPCFECTQTFSNSEELQKHLNEHENIAPPNGVVMKKLKVMMPQKDASTVEKFKLKCPICPRIFDRQYSLSRHVALHKGEKKFKCDECSAKYSLKFNLARHKRRAHNNDPKGRHTRCETCGLWFKMQATMRIHFYSHHQAENNPDLASTDDLTCPSCYAKSQTWDDHVAHATSHGLRNLQEDLLPMGNEANPVADMSFASASSNSLRKPHKCELCYKSFSSEERLSKHMAVHGSDESKPLACEECGKRFLSNSALACHLKIHAVEVCSYDCPICGHPFDQIHALKEHVHVHRINNVYTCPSCLKEFPEYALIRKHIRAFHSEKRFQCPYCEKAFTGGDKLKAHLVKHSDKREFLCNECGKTFKRKDKLKDHVKRIHNATAAASLQNNKEKKSANFEAVHDSSSLPMFDQIPQPQLPMVQEDEGNNDENYESKFNPRTSPTDYHRFVYKCHKCLLGFKRRGMLVNHLAKRHPDIALETVPELNLPILKATKDYFCQYCNKVYKSSSKRKSHILKNHPGQKPPPSARDKAALAAAVQDKPDQNKFNPTFSTTVGSVTSQPHNCQHCHKQYATNAKLLQHLRKDHARLVPVVGEDLGDQWRPDDANNGNLAHQDNNLEYRIDGEVLQLTRVPQAEAMRLVNNGATVIHVAPEDNMAGPSTSRQPTSQSNPSFDLPPELVQVMVNPIQPAQQQPGQPQQPPMNGQDQDNQWINAYRRHPS